MASTVTHELPPILRGSEQQQLTSLRDYLVRLAQSLNAVQNMPSVTSGMSEKAAKKKTDELQKQATDLKSLILKTADAMDVRIQTNSYDISVLGDAVENVKTTYVTSDYLNGTYMNTVQQNINNTVNNIVERYDYSEIVTGIVGNDINALKSFANLITGEIRRGVIYDSSLGTDVLGIAISQSMEFYENDPDHPPTTVGEEIVYYRIKANQTFGFYTSYGWQFYVNGQKVGWFDSTDSHAALHIASAIVENGIRFGEDWIIDQNNNGIGFRYIGE